MKRVLFVDDLDSIRRAMKRLLERAGYHVTLAHDGQEALEDVLAGLQFDILITDLNMPYLRGDELIEKLRAAGHNEPMLVYTSAPKAVRECGCDAVYDKTDFKRLIDGLPDLLK